MQIIDSLKNSITPIAATAATLATTSLGWSLRQVSVINSKFDLCSENISNRCEEILLIEKYGRTVDLYNYRTVFILDRDLAIQNNILRKCFFVCKEELINECGSSASYIRAIALGAIALVSFGILAYRAYNHFHNRNHMKNHAA